MLKLFWYCLDMSEEDQNFVSDKLVELSNLLKTPPAGITLEVKPLPPSLVEVVESIYESWCNHDFPFCKFCKQVRIKLNSLNSKPCTREGGYPVLNIQNFFTRCTLQRNSLIFVQKYVKIPTKLGERLPPEAGRTRRPASNVSAR